MKLESGEFDESVVALDTYNSDLNLIIDGARYSAHPLTSEGFAFMWAGARSTHGMIKGKCCYEVKIVKHVDVSHLPADEPNPHVVRVGFSVDTSTLQLGEDPQSYGYGGTGKISTNCQFKDFGSTFQEGDVILALLNMESDPIQIGFAKNGSFIGWAYRVNKNELQGKAIFPHVLSKNCSFEVNFGQKDKPFFPLPDVVKTFQFLKNVPIDNKKLGTKPPVSREECEMVMMCGLPGAGKSVWAAEYSQKNPDKKFNVLGTNNIIDKMKVMGLPRKRNYAGRWEVLIQMATKCLNKMFEIGSKLRRNYILDQTNVYPTAQRRKMQNFTGFKRTAVVIVPTDEEYKRRCNKRDREEGKEVPDSAVLEMKANFKIPEKCEIFDEVVYTELKKDEAMKLVREYNEEGKAAVGPGRKQFKSNDGNRGAARGRGGFTSRGRGFSSNRGGFDSGQGGFDSAKSGFGSGRGGYDGGRGNFGSGRGGYDSGRGGYDSGRGGYDSGRGGYDSGRGGYDSGRGGYDSGRGGYDSGQGGFDSSQGGYDSGRGGYDSSRSGYDSIRGGYGYDSGRGGQDGGQIGYAGGRGGYAGGRGGYEGGQSGRGSYEGGQGTYDSGRSGQSGYDNERSGFDSNRGNFGGGNQGSRGGYDSSRGGFDSNRGSYETSRGSGGDGYDSPLGGFDRKRKYDDRYDSLQSGSGNSPGGYDSNYSGQGDSSSGFGNNSRGFGSRGRGNLSESGISGNRSGYGNKDYGNENTSYYSGGNVKQEPTGYDRGSFSGGSPSSGGANPRGGYRGGQSSRGYSSGNSGSQGKDSFGSDDYSRNAQGSYSTYGRGASSTGTYGAELQSFKREPGLTPQSGGYDSASRTTRASGRTSRWSAEVPQTTETARQDLNSYSYGTQVKAEPASGTGSSRYDAYAEPKSNYVTYIPNQSNQGYQSTQSYDYQQGVSSNSASQPWSAASSVGSTPAGQQTQDQSQWSQYYQQQSQSDYYNQYYGQQAAANTAYGSTYGAK